MGTAPDEIHNLAGWPQAENHPKKVYLKEEPLCAKAQTVAAPGLELPLNPPAEVARLNINR